MGRVFLVAAGGPLGSVARYSTGARAFGLPCPPSPRGAAGAIDVVGAAASSFLFDAARSLRGPVVGLAPARLRLGLCATSS
jgi:hypothetical protein